MAMDYGNGKSTGPVSGTWRFSYINKMKAQAT
ncbi:uncharacterized protein G2W53_028501 [Senna tora]|uniref:Uncharacterized protein n=1 Tax=Senna tora TaxID=362788 RepID=A0A834T634_9FABA|nr:uncharacterized protein G2W53_028501 [Senna tora]